MDFDDHSGDSSDADDSIAAVVVNGGEDDATNAESDELQAWREVHSHLILAVRTAQDAVARQQQQRRYWLEELVTNLSEDGTLAVTSYWNRPVSLASYAEGSKPRVVVPLFAAAPKRKKRDSLEARDKAPKKPRKKKDDVHGGEGIKKGKKGKTPDNSNDDDFDDPTETSLRTSTWDDSFRSDTIEAARDLSNSQHSQASLTESVDYPSSPYATARPTPHGIPHEASLPDDSDERPPVPTRPFDAVAPRPAAPRTYTSIQEIANVDEDSDQDPF